MHEWTGIVWTGVLELLAGWGYSSLDLPFKFVRPLKHSSTLEYETVVAEPTNHVQ